MTTYFENTICNPAIKWQPPQYPDLDSPVWKEQFLVSPSEVRVNIATAWVVALQDKVIAALTEDSDVSEKYELVLRYLSKDVERFRMLQPYVDLAQTRGRTPHFDGSREQLLDMCGASILKKEIGSEFKKHLDAAWFGEPDQRIGAMHALATVFHEIDCQRLDCDAAYLLVPQLAWELCKDNPKLENRRLPVSLLYTCLGGYYQPHEHLTGYTSAMVSLGMQAVRTFDHSNTLVAGEELQKLRSFNVAATLSEEHPALTATLVPTLYAHSCHKEKLKHGSLLGSRLHPDATVFDALRYLVPEYKTHWDTAEALSLSPDEITEQVFSMACSEGATKKEDLATQSTPQDFN